jgi:hypothetical protein
MTDHVTWRGCRRRREGGLTSEAVPRLALPDGLVESLTQGEVSLALGALHELAALRREQNKSPNAFSFRYQARIFKRVWGPGIDSKE